MMFAPFQRRPCRYAWVITPRQVDNEGHSTWLDTAQSNRAIAFPLFGENLRRMDSTQIQATILNVKRMVRRHGRTIQATSHGK
jgi:hypothetical protein